MTAKNEASIGVEAVADIAIISVQYNNIDDTRTLISSLANLTGIEGCTFVLVDNSTNYQAADMIPVSRGVPFPVRVLRTPKNLYYWGGAQFGLDSLGAATNSMPSWVMICNNDVTIEDPLFLARLRALDPSTYPIVAPAITSFPQGRQQNPMLRSPAGPLKRMKWRAYDLGYPVAKTMLRLHAMTRTLFAPIVSDRSSVNVPSDRERIYAPHGSCIIFSSAFFANGGSLDTTVPMFAEELTIAAQAERLGLPIWYCPELKVVHREHSTTGHDLTRKKYEMERSARKHYFRLVRQ